MQPFACRISCEALFLRSKTFSPRWGLQRSRELFLPPALFVRAPLLTHEAPSWCVPALLSLIYRLARRRSQCASGQQKTPVSAALTLILWHPPRFLEAIPLLVYEFLTMWQSETLHIWMRAVMLADQIPVGLSIVQERKKRRSLPSLFYVRRMSRYRNYPQILGISWIYSVLYPKSKLGISGKWLRKCCVEHFRIW